MFKADRLPRPIRQEEHLGCGQFGAIAQDDALRAIGDVEGDVIAALPVEYCWRRADHHARRTEGVEIVGPQRHALEPLAGLRAGADDLDPLVVAQYHQTTAIAASGGLEQPSAVERQRIGTATGEQVKAQAARIHRQHRPRDATASSIGHGEVAVTRFVVLRMAPQHIRRGQQHLAEQFVAHPGAGEGQLPGQRPGAAAHELGGRCPSQPGLAVEFDPVRAGQQGVGRRQQGVGSRRQAGHAATDADLLADQRVDGAAFGGHRRDALNPGHNGVDRIVGQSRQVEAALLVETHQRVVARIGGATAAGNETGAEQFAAAGKIQRRSGRHPYGAATQVDPGIHYPPLVEATADAGQGDFLPGIAPDLAVYRAAVGQGQAGAADRGQAARQQLDLVGVLADFQIAQRSAHDAALNDARRPQRQATEDRQGLLWRRRVAALDTQAARRVERRSGAIGLVAVAGENPRARPGARIELRSADEQIAATEHLGVDALYGRRVPRQQTYVARAGQLDPVEATPVNRLRPATGVAETATRAEDQAVADIQHLRAGFEERLARLPGNLEQAGRQRLGFVVLRRFVDECSRQQQGRCRQPDPAIAGGAFAKPQCPAVEAQTLRQGQLQIAGETQQAVAEQGQVTEPAILYLARRQAAMAIGIVSPFPGGFALLADDQLARAQHLVGRQAGQVVRRGQRQRQAAGGGTFPAGEGAQVAIQVQAIGRRQGDTAAGAADPGLADSGHVQKRLGAGGIQQASRAQVDEQFGGIGLAAGMFDRAADDDAATIGQLAVAPPLEVQRGRSACGDIEHTLLANADGALVADALDLVAHRIGQRHAAQFDRAAPGVQATIDVQLADAAQLDALAGIDLQQAATTDVEDAVGHLPGTTLAAAGLQEQAGAGTLAQFAVGRPLLV
ncbi:hypothetical protein PA103_5102 [Pseudomonas aeruginosa PA103]|nr:hypothetical protein PA103_5102 [Pseudomonas aeruginosa PA103]